MLNFIRMIGLPFLLSLVVAFSITVVALWLTWRVSARMGKLLTLVILLVTGTFVVAKSASPTGRYVIAGCKGPGLDWFGISDEYYELSDGILYEVVDGRRHRTGSYYKKNGQWILRVDRADGVLDEQTLRFSILGFDTVIPPIEGNEGGPTTFNRRRLIPFTKPRWMPEWLE